MTEIEKLTLVLNTKMSKNFTSDEIDYFIILSYLNNPRYYKNIVMKRSYIDNNRLYIGGDGYYGNIDIKIQDLKNEEIKGIRESIQYL